MSLRFLFTFFTYIFFAAVPLGAADKIARGVHYRLEISSPETHVIEVTMTVPSATDATVIAFPAWYGLFQIRDFVRNVQNLKARCGPEPRRLIQIDPRSWKLKGGDCPVLEIRYRVLAEKENVFSSFVGPRRGFLNPATLLFHVGPFPISASRKEEKARPVTVKFVLPEGWKAAMPLREVGRAEFRASSYYELADSPAELGLFEEYVYRQKGALYRLVVSADSDPPVEEQILPMVKTITRYQTRLMEDVPFSRFTFFLHFPKGRGSGGMEHRNAAAVDFNGRWVRSREADLASLIAHEFFHLWNAKRIRPLSLGPPDYWREKYTDSLWFLEGLTSTYASYTLVRTGLISRRVFYRRLAGRIEKTELRPAARFQSLTGSSLSAWLEKYPKYLLPERSISYYFKGEVVGVLLDLAIRRKTGNRRSLDDVLRAMNREFGRPNRPFEETAELRRVVEEVAGASFENFFDRYIYGTEPLPYRDLRGYVGLELQFDASAKPKYAMKEIRNASGKQRDFREAWLRGETRDPK